MTKPKLGEKLDSARMSDRVGVDLHSLLSQHLRQTLNSV